VASKTERGALLPNGYVGTKWGKKRTTEAEKCVKRKDQLNSLPHGVRGEGQEISMVRKKGEKNGELR